jgi:prepilin peptidase CpaA
MQPGIFESLVIFCFVVLLIWAALSDIRSFIIPNMLCLAIAGLYPVYVVASAHTPDWPIAVAIAAGVFVLGAVLFAFNLIGGGDIKLLSATLLWAGPEYGVMFLVITVLFGGVLAVAMLIWTKMHQFTPFLWRLVGPPMVSGEHAAKQSMPYGVAISFGGLFVAGAHMGVWT